MQTLLAEFNPTINGAEITNRLFPRPKVSLIELLAYFSDSILSAEVSYKRGSFPVRASLVYPHKKCVCKSHFQALFFPTYVRHLPSPNITTKTHYYHNVRSVQSCSITLHAPSRTQITTWFEKPSLQPPNLQSQLTNLSGTLGTVRHIYLLQRSVGCEQCAYNVHDCQNPAIFKLHEPTLFTYQSRVFLFRSIS